MAAILSLAAIVSFFSSIVRRHINSTLSPGARCLAPRAKGTGDKFFCAKFFAAFSEKSRA